MKILWTIALAACFACMGCNNDAPVATDDGPIWVARNGSDEPDKPIEAFQFPEKKPEPPHIQMLERIVRRFGSQNHTDFGRDLTVALRGVPVTFSTGYWDKRIYVKVGDRWIDEAAEYEHLTAILSANVGAFWDYMDRLDAETRKRDAWRRLKDASFDQTLAKLKARKREGE